MKFKILFCFLALSWLSSAQAYPWMFFRQDDLPGILKLDAHGGYFVKGQAAVFAGVHLDYHHPTIDINLGYNYSFLEKKHYPRLSELALVFPFISEKWKMSVGFKDVLWSEADRYWNYGLWQSRYLLDAFRPVQMGLPGLYFDYTGETSFTLLLSYFYLPDIIIYPELENGKVVSRNPFFVQSFDQFQWNVESLDPFQIKRFFKPTVAFQMRHFIKQSNLSLSYAYKPANQFQYSALVPGINLSNSIKSQWQIEDFNYSIVQHHLASLEGETVLLDSLSLFASMFYERPEKQTYGKNWISDEFEPHLTFSVLAYFQEKRGDSAETLFTLGWTKTLDSQSQKDTSNTVTEDYEKAFNRSFMWKEAVSASIEYHDRDLFEGFLFRLRGNYALDNDFYHMALENYFYLTPHARLYLSGDVIFRLSSAPLKQDSSSIKEYRDLSRLLVGGQYVF